MPESDPAPSSSSRPGRNAAIYVGVWFLVLTGLVAQYRWGITNNWTQAFVKAMRDWIPWFALGPFVWWLVKKYPLFHGQRLRNFAIHFITSIALVVVAQFIVAFTVHPLTQPMLERSRLSPAPEARENRRPNRRQQQESFRIRPQQLSRKAQTAIPLYWVLVFLASTMQLRRQSQERKQRALALERDLVAAQLKTLQNRLQPHFLFNALNSISALIRIDPDKSEVMIERLSGLLRNVLATGDKQRIPLRQELDLLRDYLAIEAVRFSDRLTIEEDIDDTILDRLVPPLLLQPIAENAMKHGIEPKTEPSILRVAVTGQDSSGLLLTIQDDGIGFNESSNSGSGSSIGLSNIRSRLEALYEDRASLSISSPPEGGTRVDITLPSETK